MGADDRSDWRSSESRPEAVSLDLSFPDDLWKATDARHGAEVADAPSAPELLIATPVGCVESMSRPQLPADWEWDEAIMRDGRRRAE